MKKVTKAVLACGGWSTRFLPTTKAYAKQLLPILDKPQILYVLLECVNAGLSEFCIVHREGETTLQEFLKPNPELTDYLKNTGKEKFMKEYESIISRITRFEFVPQTNDLPYGTGAPILAAKDFIGQDDFVYIFGDDLTVEKDTGHFLSQLIKTYQSNEVLAAFAVQEVPREEIFRYGCIEYAKTPSIKNQIVRIIEKPAPEDAPSNMANDGRAVVSNEIMSVIGDQPLGFSKELQFIDSINILAEKGVVVTENFLDHNARWMTTGDPVNLLRANIAMAKLHGINLD